MDMLTPIIEATPNIDVGQTGMTSMYTPGHNENAFTPAVNMTPSSPMNLLSPTISPYPNGGDMTPYDNQSSQIYMT